MDFVQLEIVHTIIGESRSLWTGQKQNEIQSIAVQTKQTNHDATLALQPNMQGKQSETKVKLKRRSSDWLE